MYRTAEALYQGYYDRHGVLVRDRRSWMVSRFVEQLLRGEPMTRAQWDRYGAAGGRPEFLFETVNKLAASHRAPPPVWWRRPQPSELVAALRLLPGMLSQYIEGNGLLAVAVPSSSCV